MEFLSHPAHPYGRVHVGSAALGVFFKGDLLSGLVFIPGWIPGWVDTSLWIRLGRRVSIDGYLSFIQEWMCSYEHCAHFARFQRNKVRATRRDLNCRACLWKRKSAQSAVWEALYLVEMYTCNVKLCRALGRFGRTVFITCFTLSILAQAKSGWDSGVSVPPSPPLWPGPRWFPRLGSIF